MMNNDGNENSENQKKKEIIETNTRREFFKKSVLGIGGITLASQSALAGEEKLEEEKLRDQQESFYGDDCDCSDIDYWLQPSVVDLTEKIGDFTKPKKPHEVNSLLSKFHYYKSLQIDPKVPFSNVPYSLTVDDNVSGKTPGGTAVLYGYNGTVPGPTFIIDGDQDLEILLWNHLPGNDGKWACKSGSRFVKTNERVKPDTRDWQIDGHLYGPHQQNVTNLHTHGLHISPGVFSKTQKETAKQVQSDNVLLRVIPLEDYYNREVLGQGPKLLNNEVVGFVRYKFSLPRTNKKGEKVPHYPGTHWYHPHPHGATFDQVAGGMAGFLIVKGAIDKYLEDLFKENNYLDLPLLIQRVLGPTLSPNAESDSKKKQNAKGSQKKTKNVGILANGSSNDLPTQSVQPNQILRLRVLNGSVDGRGYLRLFLQKGDCNQKVPFINPNNSLYKYNNRVGGKSVKNASASAKLWYNDEADQNAVPLLNIAYDGINLMDQQGDYSAMGVEWLSVGVANRSDFLIAIPQNAKVGDIYTIWGQQMIEALDADGGTSAYNNSNLNQPLGQFKVISKEKLSDTYIDQSTGLVQVDWKSQGKVDEILMPVTDDDITIKDNKESTDAFLPPNPVNLQNQAIKLSSDDNANKAIRARRIIYSGWGDGGVNEVAYSPTLKTNPTVKELYNSMLIDGKKYGADTPHHAGWDTAQHKMLVNTAEEWTVYNYSMTSYIQDYKKPSTDKDNYLFGIPTYKNANGSKIKELDGANPNVMTKAVHHPFHIHQNAFWVKSIQDYEGNELLPIDENGDPIPRWQDVVYIPHNGGRVIFRSRFMDYTGKYVNHCHLLQHEDWGMMQAVEVVDGKENKPNYIPLPKEDAQNVFPGLNIKQMMLLDIGKVKEAFFDKDVNNPLKMLCYNPKTETFFKQNKLTKLVAKQVPDGYFECKFGLKNCKPDPAKSEGCKDLDIKGVDSESCCNGINSKQVIYWDQQNVGNLIIPVPESGKVYPAWGIEK